MRLDCDGQHTFCQVCIERWFENHKTCPIGRHAFKRFYSLKYLTHFADIVFVFLSSLVIKFLLNFEHSLHNKTFKQIIQ